jgi:hypothetical protein
VGFITDTSAELRDFPGCTRIRLLEHHAWPVAHLREQFRFDLFDNYEPAKLQTSCAFGSRSANFIQIRFLVGTLVPRIQEQQIPGNSAF